MENKSLNSVKIISIILSFFISFLLFITLSLTVVNQTILNVNYCISSMEKTDYYDMLSSGIESQLKYYSAASGFSEDVFDGTVDTKELTENVNGSVNALYTGNKVKINTSSLEKNLRNNFISYANNNNIVITNDISTSIDELVSECITTYEKYISVSILSYISPFIIKATNIVPKIIIGLLILIVILFAAILMINKRKYRAIRNYIYAVSGSAMMLAALPLVYFISGKIYKIGLSFKPIYDLVVYYVNNIFIDFIKYSALLCLVVAVLSVIYCVLKKKSIEEE